MMDREDQLNLFGYTPCDEELIAGPMIHSIPIKIEFDPYGEQNKHVRTFDTGATRSPLGDKLCYAGFNDSRVEKRYAEYMHKHRLQSDGTLRAPDNWKNGIPLESYHDSMARHFKDIELYMQGYESEMSEDIMTALCAMRFNVTGMMFEMEKGE